MIEVQSRTSCEDLIKEKDKEIERLTNELNKCMIDHNKLLDRIDKAIEYIEIIQKQWNEESVPERNIYLFETYIKGVTKLVEIKDILEGDNNGKN